MANKTPKLNTNLDDDVVQNDDEFAVDDLAEVEPIILEEGAVEGTEDATTSYTMGEVVVAGSDEEEEKLDLKKIKPEEDDEDEEWVDDEYIQDDYDPYLDDANYDMDNPYGDDDL